MTYSMSSSTPGVDVGTATTHDGKKNYYLPVLHCCYCTVKSVSKKFFGKSRFFPHLTLNVSSTLRSSSQPNHPPVQLCSLWILVIDSKQDADKLKYLACDNEPKFDFHKAWNETWCFFLNIFYMCSKLVAMSLIWLLESGRCQTWLDLDFWTQILLSQSRIFTLINGILMR